MRAAGSRPVGGFLRVGVLRGAFAHAAVAAVAFLEFHQGFEEARTVEIRPKSIGDENFGVSNLPEEEIADAHFAAGADEEVGVGEAGGIKMAGQLR